MLERLKFDEFKGTGFEFNDFEVDFQKLAVLVGVNGSGKTMILKTAWFSSLALNIYKTLALAGVPNIDEMFTNEVNAMFELTYHQSEELNGAIQISDRDLDIFEFSLITRNGKLDNFQLNIFDKEKFDHGVVENVRFNSKNARTFEQYENYIKIRKTIGIDRITSNDDVKKLAEFYRLYDILWFEDIKNTIDGFSESPETLDSLLGVLGPILDGDAGFKDMEVFKGNVKIIAKDSLLYIHDEDGHHKSFSSLGSGEQSILMMFLFTRN